MHFIKVCNTCPHTVPPLDFGNQSRQVALFNQWSRHNLFRRLRVPAFSGSSHSNESVWAHVCTRIGPVHVRLHSNDILHTEISTRLGSVFNCWFSLKRTWNVTRERERDDQSNVWLHAKQLALRAWNHTSTDHSRVTTVSARLDWEHLPSRRSSARVSAFPTLCATKRSTSTLSRSRTKTSPLKF